MTKMVWNAIEHLRGCRRLTPPRGYAQLFLFQTLHDNTAWLIGPYKELTPFATDLRNDTALRDFVSANRIRIGLRDTDVPPAEIERQERYGSPVKGADHDKDFTLARFNPITRPVKDFTSSRLNAVAGPAGSTSVNRKTDREENVRSFWTSQTPQSHHIVEFNNLETLGASHKIGNTEMDYLQLPAVLLAAEFHQRYISAILKPAQRWGAQQLKSSIASVYRDLYLRNNSGKGGLFEPLWEISKVILNEAGIKIA
jgi:hypothetical protein